MAKGPTTYKLRAWEAHDGWYWTIGTFQGRDIITAPNSFKTKASALYAARRAIDTIRGGQIEDVSGSGSTKFTRKETI